LTYNELLFGLLLMDEELMKLFKFLIIL